MARVVREFDVRWEVEAAWRTRRDAEPVVCEEPADVGAAVARLLRAGAANVSVTRRETPVLDNDDVRGKT